jgi:pentatricopeptide repeat protein
LIDACINCGKLEIAVSLLKDEKTLSDTVSFNTVIKGCTIERKDRVALEIFAYMKS